MDLVAVCVRKTAQNLHFLMQKKSLVGSQRGQSTKPPVCCHFFWTHINISSLFKIHFIYNCNFFLFWGWIKTGIISLNLPLSNWAHHLQLLLACPRAAFTFDWCWLESLLAGVFYPNWGGEVDELRPGRLMETRPRCWFLHLLTGRFCVNSTQRFRSTAWSHLGSGREGNPGELRHELTVWNKMIGF